MKKQYINHVKPLLFNAKNKERGLKTYAVVEQARHLKAFDELHFSTLNYVNLWHEGLGEEREIAALYLVELEEENTMVNYLLALHHEALAVYFLSPYNLETLRDYYHTFTMPSVERKPNEFQNAVFGCFDPLVLPNYIETLYSPEKVREFFNGIALTLVPNSEETDKVQISYRVQTEKVESIEVDMSKPIDFDINTILMNNEMVLGENIEQRTIDYKQIEIFEEFSKQTFLKRALRAYKNGESSEMINFENYDVRADRLFEEAREEHGIFSEAGVYRYILLGLLLEKPLSQFSFFTKISTFIHEKIKVDELDRLITYITSQQKEQVDG